MPVFAMSIYLLSVSTCMDIERCLNRFWWGSRGRNDRKIHWISWKNLCVSKSQGGLGFKQIREFNIALLGKQAWRFITNPDSLVAKIFKARYYTNCSLFEAPIGHNPSYCWRSILAAKDLIKECCAKRIGNGKTTSIWKDVWVADQKKLATPIIPDLGEAKVSSLTKMDEPAEWDSAILEDLFVPEDRERILNTPISPSFDDDWY